MRRNKQTGFVTFCLLTLLGSFVLSGWLLVEKSDSEPRLITLLDKTTLHMHQERALDFINIHILHTYLEHLNTLDYINSIHHLTYLTYTLSIIVRILQPFLLTALKALQMLEWVFEAFSVGALHYMAVKLCKKNNLGFCLPFTRHPDKKIPIPLYRLFKTYRAKILHEAPGYLKIKPDLREDGFYFGVLPFKIIPQFIKQGGRFHFFEHLFFCTHITSQEETNGIGLFPPSLKAEGDLCPPSTWTDL